MLLRADIGLFFCSLVSVVVGWFVVRRKWRRVVARRQEIQRLLNLASEETSRAEFEAVASYGSYEEESLVMFSGSPIQKQFHHQCELCFSPTTTRCKRCKAVHYCSGKCQIIHWRQGHKNECDLLASYQKIDVGLQKYDNQWDNNLNGIEERHPYKPSLASSEELFLSNPSFHFLNEKNDPKVENEKDVNENAKASVQPLPNERSSSSSTILGDLPISSTRNFSEPRRIDEPVTSSNVEKRNPILSQKSSSINPPTGVESSGLPNQGKSGCIDTDMLSESSTSSSISSTGSSDHTISEPSTSSSPDYWEATREDIKSMIKVSDKLSDVNTQNFSSCSSSLGGSNINVKVLAFGRSSEMVDVPTPSSMPKNSTDESISPVRKNSDCLKSREPIPSSRSASHAIAINTWHECSPKTEGSKFSVSITTIEGKVSKSEGNTSNKDVAEVSNLQFSVAALLNKSDLTSVTTPIVECEKDHFPRLKISETHVHTRSCTQKHAMMDTQSMGNGDTWVDTCSKVNTGCAQNERNENNIPGRRMVDKVSSSYLIQNCYLSSKSGTVGKYEGSFSYEHFVQLYNWSKVELRPCGLINCGNSCYANAVLQCLVFTPPLTAYFLQGLHSKACKTTKWCFTCEFEALIRKAAEGKSPLSAATVLAQMGPLGSHLGNGREEDAHEFLRYTIDAMQFVHLKESGSMDEDTTLVGLAFGGYLRSKIDCMRCGGKSEQHERMMDLTVEIGGGVSTLENALEQFTRSEILDGDNKYHCDRCKSYQKAKKKLRVLEAPNVLTITLKRFQSGQYGKLNKVVKFPEILNLAPYMSGTSDKSPIYRLYGVIVHLDAMNATFSGHYVCYIKNNRGKWYKADDSMVREVDIEEVLASGSYILLYARCSPRFPRLIRHSTASRDLRKVKIDTKSHSHPKERWDVSMGKLNHQICNDCFYQQCRQYHLTEANEEDDILSDNSSSIFSDAGSFSTENSNKESTTTDDSFDQILGESGNNWSKPCRSSSDSDTSSPSPHYTRHSPLSDLDRYSSDAETSGSSAANASSGVDGNSFQSSSSNEVSILTGIVGSSSSSLSDSYKKLLGSRSSSSSQCDDSCRVGSNNPEKNVNLGRSIR